MGSIATADEARGTRPGVPRRTWRRSRSVSHGLRRPSSLAATPDCVSTFAPCRIPASASTFSPRSWARSSRAGIPATGSSSTTITSSPQPLTSERFVAELVDACPLQVLIASRQRPSWISGRSILYGEVLELNQTALAMDSREAAEVLANRSSQSASGLVALANGWPAVIALAGVSSAEIEADMEVPESLYRFFAEEIFGSLGDDVRQGLALLAVAPVLDRELADELLGDESRRGRLQRPLSTSGSSRSATSTSSFIRLHARSSRSGLPTALVSWVERRAPQRLPSPVQGEARLGRRVRRHRAARAERVISRHFSRRPSTSSSRRRGSRRSRAGVTSQRMRTVDQPMFSIARAEVALRHGRHAEAQSFAEAAAAAGEPALTFRGLAVAGRAAHLASREEDGLRALQAGGSRGDIGARASRCPLGSALVRNRTRTSRSRGDARASSVRVYESPTRGMSFARQLTS